MASDDPTATDRIVRATPMRRVGEPEDVARALAWLMAPDQSWVTGQVVAVDGGLGCIQARAA